MKAQLQFSSVRAKFIFCFFVSILALIHILATRDCHERMLFIAFIDFQCMAAIVSQDSRHMEANTRKKKNDEEQIIGAVVFRFLNSVASNLCRLACVRACACMDRCRRDFPQKQISIRSRECTQHVECVDGLRVARFHSSSIRRENRPGRRLLFRWADGILHEI